MEHDLRYLILRHELGGEKQDGMNLHRRSEIDRALNLNDLADVVTDADSLANKVHFMYDRMTASAQDELRDSILFSGDHILGSPSDDDDIRAIRVTLVEICD